MLRRQAEYEARRAQAKDLRPASRENPAVAPADVPAPPFWGWKVLLGIPVDDVVECIDRNTLYRMQWGGRNLKGEEWDRIVREDFEPRLKRYTLEARTQRWLSPKAVYGYFPAAATATPWSSSTRRTARRRSGASTSRGRRTASSCAWRTTSAR